MNRHRTICKRGIALILCIAFGLVLGSSVAASTNLTEETQSIEDRVVGFARQLRLGISVASFAVYSPTLRDLRLHAQQLINLLEGAAGRHFARGEGWEDVPVGLLMELTSWNRRFGEVPWSSEQRTRLTSAVRNLKIYLDLALDAALSILERNRLDHAIADMLRLYAYLSAAFEIPSDGGAVPSLGTILQAFGAEDPNE